MIANTDGMRAREDHPPPPQIDKTSEWLIEWLFNLQRATACGQKESGCKSDIDLWPLSDRICKNKKTPPLNNWWW